MVAVVVAVAANVIVDAVVAACVVIFSDLLM